MPSQFSPRRKAWFAAALATSLLAGPALAQSPMSATAPPPKFPAMPAASGARPAADMQAVLDAQASLGGKPVELLTPAQARLQPSPTDGVKTVLMKQGKSTVPDPAVVTRELPYGAHPQQIARIYMPAVKPSSAMPVIVYYHGGGWVIADIDTYDASARQLSLGAEAVVVSSHYRQAPEDMFPASHDDAYAAYVWAVENSGELNGDAARMAIAGESAGANLAANVAIMARDAKITQPLHQLLVYPIAGNDMTTPSYVENADAAPLGKADMAWFVDHAFAAEEDAADPRINLVDRDDLSGLPPATLITAQIDPLRSESIAYGEALMAAGGKVEMNNYDGVTHEFFGMGSVVPQAVEAMTFATTNLKAALAK